MKTNTKKKEDQDRTLVGDVGGFLTSVAVAMGGCGGGQSFRRKEKEKLPI